MAGQAEVVRVVATVVAICAGIATAYFLGAVALALGAAQATAVTGRPGTLSRAFEPLMPAPGPYKLWVQFQRRGKVSTASFVVAVREPGSKDPGLR